MMMMSMIVLVGVVLPEFNFTRSVLVITQIFDDVHLLEQRAVDFVFAMPHLHIMGPWMNNSNDYSNQCPFSLYL